MKFGDTVELIKNHELNNTELDLIIPKGTYCKIIKTQQDQAYVMIEISVNLIIKIWIPQKKLK